MDFSLSPDLRDLQQRTRAFVRDKIIPLEGDPRQTAHGPTEEFRRELVTLGLHPPHALASDLKAASPVQLFSNAGFGFETPAGAM